MIPRRPLVGVEIHDGLGNQLFQYAAAYSLALRRGADLRIDTRLMRRKAAHRPLALDRFGITWTECLDPEARGSIRAAARALRIDGNPFRSRIFREGGFAFDPEIDTVACPVFLKGYFQSWRYFKGSETDLRRKLDPSKFASDRTATIAAAIRSAPNPVMVHVRRGDYVTANSDVEIYKLLEADYYEPARETVRARISDPSYFIFSDDIGAARALLGHWPNAMFVSGFSDLEDLMLMSFCRHFIIANSTFSWWAAWLGQKGDSFVIAPAKWFGRAMAERSLADLFPSAWEPR